MLPLLSFKMVDVACMNLATRSLLMYLALLNLHQSVSS